MNLNREPVSKAQEVRDYYDEGLTSQQIADRMGIEVELVELVLDNYDEDWRERSMEEIDDDFPMFLEYDDWKYDDTEYA